jgi:hypothetical protein
MAHGSHDGSAGMWPDEHRAWCQLRRLFRCDRGRLHINAKRIYHGCLCGSLRAGQPSNRRCGECMLLVWLGPVAEL